MTTLVELELLHFFNIDHEVIPLKDQGLVLMVGPNGTGKTAFVIEGVYYGAFGRSFEYGEAPGTKVMNRWSKSMLVRLDFDVDGTLWRIVRCRGKVEGYRAGLSLWRIDGTPEDFSLDSSDATQQRIQQIMGITPRVFTNTVMFSTDLLRFPDFNDTDKKRVIDELTGTSHIGKALELTKKYLAAAQQELTLEESLMQSERQHLEADKNQLASMTLKSESWEVAAKARVEKNKSEVKNLKQDITQYEATVKSVNADLARVQAQRSQAQLIMQAAAAKQQEAEQSRPKSESSSHISGQVSVIRSQIKVAQKTAPDTCYACGQSLPKTESATVPIDVLNDKLGEAIASLNMARVAESAALQAWEESTREVREAYEKAVVAYAAEGDTERSLRDIQSQNASDLRLARSKLLGATLEAQENPFSDTITDLEDGIDKCLESLQKRKNKIITLRKTVKDEAILERAFSSKGCRLKVLKPVMPFLNKQAQEVAAAFGVEMDVTFSIRDEDAAHAGTIQIGVDNPIGAFGYHGNSAGQRRMVDLIVLFSLVALASLAGKVEFAQSFFDETFEKLDEEHRKGLLKVLHHISKTKSSTFIIAHASKDIPGVDQIWHVQQGKIWKKQLAA